MPRPQHQQMPGHPGEAVYDLTEALVVFFTIRGREVVNRKTLARMCSDKRDPGKIWGRRIGQYWLLPESSIVDFLRGTCRPGQCPCCGARLPEFLAGDADLVLQIRAKVEGAKSGGVL